MASSTVFTNRNWFSGTVMLRYLNSTRASSSSTFGSYTYKSAPSCMSISQTVSAGVSRTSPVSFLKAKPKMAIFFLDTVLKSTSMSFREPLLHVLVHIDNLLPIVSDLWQTKLLTKVDQVQNVLLEARTTEANGGVQKLLANARISTYCP